MIAVSKKELNSPRRYSPPRRMRIGVALIVANLFVLQAAWANTGQSGTPPVLHHVSPPTGPTGGQPGFVQHHLGTSNHFAGWTGGQSLHANWGFERDKSGVQSPSTPSSNPPVKATSIK